MKKYIILIATIAIVLLVAIMAAKATDQKRNEQDAVVMKKIRLNEAEACKAYRTACGIYRK